VSTYYLLHVLAAVAAGLLFFHLMIRNHANPGLVRRIIVAIALAGAAGAVLGGVLLDLAAGRPPDGGLSAIGVLGGALVGTLLSCRSHHLPAGPVVDRGAVAASLWLGIGRIGCASAGCCYGQPTRGPFGWRLPDTAGCWLPRFPTQLLNAAADLLIFALLLFLLRRSVSKPQATRLRPGDLGWLFAALYAATRFAIDFLRGDQRPILGPLTPTQLVALGILASTAAATALRLRSTIRR